MAINISPTRPHSLIDHIIQLLLKRIANRSLQTGDKLPSIRALAADTGISKTTITEAYDRLVAKGIIYTRPRSGFFVAPTVIPLSLDTETDAEKDIDPLWVAKQSLEPNEILFKPSCGWLPVSWMPDTIIRRAMRSTARASADMLVNYDVPKGSFRLRHIISQRLAKQHIHASPDQCILTDSTTQAIDLICRLILSPNDVVLVDDPCYFNFLALMRAHRINIVSVPYTPTGPDLSALPDIINTHRPKLYLTNVSVHNPTGAMLSSAAAHRILQLAEQHNFIIIEDQTFSDFEHQPSTHLAALDALQRVFVVGGFTKTLSASVRCGFIISPQQWLNDLVNLRVATNFSCNRLSAEIIASALENSSYRKHLHILHQELTHAMSYALTHLKRIGFTPWLEPTAGMFIWCAMPSDYSSSQLAQQAMRDYKIALAPGNVFSHNHNADQFIRFNASQMTEPHIYTLLEQLLNNYAHVKP